MQEWAEKASVLIEALPYIQRFAGKTMVIKYGGSAMGGPFEQVILDIIWLKQAGIRPVVVHGGGKEISSFLQRLQVESRFVDGLRVTDGETMNAVEMVLGGSINKRIAATFYKNGAAAVGLTGVDGGLLKVRQKRQDLGQVGEVVSVNHDFLDQLLNAGVVPVIAPIGVDENGVRYNVNADSAAGAIAGALHAEKLVLLTDVPGIMRDTANGKQILNQVTPKQIQQLIEEGQITGGMVPKVEACLQALQAGAKHVHILNGEEPHALLLEVFTDKGIGTMVIGGNPNE
ncbi:acetylglutamate kinase [Effusibacillus dendaii]|uniref:Acetylglutamate kinase n=1 Tax=Effusibacillus dendaii TaxID=2743772 RepID=A0A7I8DG16_9BACL|nr:acetylglutamate kinase [Effusibacillus dendaii]BCJ87899.1 acetylglutamate kinase [Effusibacillus dendaii]